MGEVTEMILEGILCEVCGSYIDRGEDEAPGHPVKCDACLEDEENEK